jgi:hypothetical protein
VLHVAQRSSAAQTILRERPSAPLHGTEDVAILVERRFHFQAGARAGPRHYGLAVRITLSDLTVNVADVDQERLLDDWRWLIGPSKRLVLVSAIGDAFLQDEADGTIHLLDTTAGSCRLVAHGADDFRSPPGTPITEIRHRPEQG